MAVAFVAAASSSNSSSTTSISATVPAGATTGTLIVAITCAERGIVPTWTGVSGWTDILAVADGTNIAVRISWKIAQAGDASATLNATVGSGRRMAMGILVFSGADSLTSVLSSSTTATAQAGGTTSNTTPSITPDEADCMLVALNLAVKQSDPWVFNGSVSAPWTERIDECSSSASSANGAVYAATRLLSGGGGASQTGALVTQNTNVLLFSATLSIEPGSANVAPTADAGADQSDIEAYTTVTVTGSDNDTDGTVVTRTWRVISTTNGAPTPTLNGSGNSRTFKAPGAIAGTVVTLGYKVTDNGGLDSTEDICTVAVLPVTERIVVGGVEVPLEVQVVAP